MIFSVLKNYTENRISVIHFWNRFGFYKTDSEPTFGFPHIPILLPIWTFNHSKRQ